MCAFAPGTVEGGNVLRSTATAPAVDVATFWRRPLHRAAAGRHAERGG
jgi:hypothetical protein